MNRLARALLRRVGHRGTALLFFAVLDGMYSYSLFSPPHRLSPSLDFVASIAPLPLWGALWGLAGLVCLISAFTQKDQWGFSVAMLVKALWGGLFIYATIFTDLERAYLSAAIWLCFAGWIGIIASWPEPWDHQEAFGRGTG